MSQNRTVPDRAATRTGKPLPASEFGKGAREAAKAMEGHGKPSKGSGGGGMHFKIPNHPTK